MGSLVRENCPLLLLINLLARHAFDKLCKEKRRGDEERKIRFSDLEEKCDDYVTAVDFPYTYGKSIYAIRSSSLSDFGAEYRELSTVVAAGVENGGN